MSSLKADVLYIGTSSKTFSFATDYWELTDSETLPRNPYSVVIFSEEIITNAKFEFLEKLLSAWPQCRLILLSGACSVKEILDFHNRISLFAVVSQKDAVHLERQVRSALVDSSFFQQTSQLMTLYHEQNIKLTSLNQKLEARVEKRQKYLEKASQKIKESARRNETFQRALIAIHRAHTVSQMERLLMESLRELFALEWVRIVNHPSATIAEENLPLEVVSFSLQLQNQIIGKVIFARKKGEIFLEDDIGFLAELTDPVQLAMDRLFLLDQLESLKAQWDQTFNAISEPVALIAQNYDVVSGNRAFFQPSVRTKPAADSKNLKCYEVLFGRTSPCVDCQLGVNFQLTNSAKTPMETRVFDVSSQSMTDQSQNKIYVNLYRDITLQRKLEHQLVEKAKSAELGTIGSSIAHELNNPLTGIMTLLQLAQMSLKGDEPFFEDIKDMEKGTHRIRDLIEKLLGYSRKENSASEHASSLYELVQKAIEIIEIQSKSLGIQIFVNQFTTEDDLHTPADLLVQGLVHILTHSLHRVTTRLKSDRSYKPVIQIDISNENQQLQILLTDEGIETPEERPQNKMALEIASQLFQENSANLSTGLSNHQYWAKISFSRPVLHPASPNF